MADKNECFIHRAIQVLIAACDARHGRDSVSTTASTSNESPRSDDKAAITRHGTMAGHRSVNASRDRMKQEMQHLRDTVEELQRQLDELKREHSRRSPRPGSESSVTSGDDDVASPSERRLALAWEAMARGQCEQRYRAEVENVKLRKMLDEQMKVAQTLERILTKRRHTEDLLGAVRLKKRMRSSSTTVMCPIDDPTVFADLTGVIPALYAQIDVVLQKECFHDHDKVFRDVDVRHTETLGAYVESTERRLLPFTLGETAQSMWEYFAFFPEKIARNCELVPDVRRDHLEREMLVNLHPGRYKGDARVKLVARRFVEPRRTVMVWVAMVDPSDVDEAHGEGVVIRHTGWVCFRPSSLDTPEAAMTEYLTAQLSVPEVYEVVTDRKRRLTTMTNYIVGSVTCQLETGKEMLDNRLLERALARANAVKSE